MSPPSPTLARPTSSTAAAVSRAGEPPRGGPSAVHAYASAPSPSPSPAAAAAAAVGVVPASPPVAAPPAAAAPAAGVAAKPRPHGSAASANSRASASSFAASSSSSSSSSCSHSYSHSSYSSRSTVSSSRRPNAATNNNDHAAAAESYGAFWSQATARRHHHQHHHQQQQQQRRRPPPPQLAATQSHQDHDRLQERRRRGDGVARDMADRATADAVDPAGPTATATATTGMARAPRDRGGEAGGSGGRRRRRRAARRAWRMPTALLRSLYLRAELGNGRTETRRRRRAGLEGRRDDAEPNEEEEEEEEEEERVYIHERSAPDAYPAVRALASTRRKRILVTGGGGFVGSHLVDRLLLMGHEVICADNFHTGAKSTLAHWVGHPHFEMMRHDIVNPLFVEVDEIYQLACPASPRHYASNPVKTIKTSVLGSLNMLGLAKRTGARYLLASTSEVYGDPEITPQHESYNGNVNPTGPRACYDEGKRVAESLTYAYYYKDGVDVRVARIFNTYGPRMHPDDGRVVSNFLLQGLRGEPYTIFGDGSQTRSFCFIHDLVDGLIGLMEVEESSDDEEEVDDDDDDDDDDDGENGDEGEQLEQPQPSFGGGGDEEEEVAVVVGTARRQRGGRRDVHLPCNLGNPHEFTILELVEEVEAAIERLRRQGRIAPLRDAPHASSSEAERRGATAPAEMPAVDEGEEEGRVVGGGVGRGAKLASGLDKVVHLPCPPDDPRQRRPDTSRAAQLLGWRPRWSLRRGLEEMLVYYDMRLREGSL